MKKMLVIAVIGICAIECFALWAGKEVSLGMKMPDNTDAKGVVISDKRDISGTELLQQGYILQGAMENAGQHQASLKVVDGKIVRRSADEINWLVNIPAKYKIQNPDNTWREMTAEEKLAVDAAAEVARQAAKPAMQKTVENLYVTFLTNDWTTLLRNNGLIGTNETITVTNKAYAENAVYLMTLRAMGKKDDYDYYSNEFMRFKTTLMDLFKSDTSDARWHE